MLKRIGLPRIARERIGLGLIAVALAATAAGAQTWPTRQIEVIIPFPAGSGVDVIGRAVASALGAETGQTVVVVNRDGAAGTIGFGALARMGAAGRGPIRGPS